MPIYQYKCADCQHSLEALQKMSDPRLKDCPACGAASLNKQVTAAAFKLKGTGWYETDFKNSGKKPAQSESSNTADSANSTTSTDSSAVSASSDKASTNTEASGAS